MHEKLVEKHSHLGRIIPPAPEKNLAGTTKAKFQGGGDAGGAVNGSSSRYKHNLTLHSNNKKIFILMDESPKSR